LLKEDKILIKSLYECKGYNARQFITEFPDKGWDKEQHQQAAGVWWSWESSEQCDAHHFQWCNFGQI